MVRLGRVGGDSIAQTLLSWAARRGCPTSIRLGEWTHNASLPLKGESYKNPGLIGYRENPYP
jgi:hypothetical protein